MKSLSKMFIFLLAFFSLTAICNAATITGSALFEGAAPAAQKIKTDSDPTCKMSHPDGITDDEVVINSNGTLKNVFIYVKEGLAGKKFDAPKEAVVFDQKGCQYSPKVFGIMVGQPLEIHNSDSTLHNVHALSEANPQFNLGMPIQGMKLRKTFNKVEVPVKIKCEVHSWMHAYAGVVDNPFYAVSSDDGSFTIKDLPPGNYTIEAWHSKYGVQDQKISVKSADDKQDVKFSFKS